MTETELHIRDMQSFIIRNKNRKKVAKLAGVHEHTVSRFVHKHGAIALSTFIKIEKSIIKIKEKVIIKIFFIIFLKFQPQ